MTTNELVGILKNEANNNPAASAVFCVWASRKRARKQVTVAALSNKMHLEGFKYSREQYAAVLKRMASLGIGKLETDSKGRVRALKDITTTLQSIGMAACGSDLKLKGYKQRAKFASIPETKAPIVKEAPKQTDQAAVQLVVLINNKRVSIPIPQDLTTDEISRLVSGFQFKSS